MSPPANTQAIMKEFARQLKNAAPDVFQSFTEAFELYTIEALQALGQAPQDQILNQQGRAQQCQALLRFFNECHLTRPPPTPQAPNQDWSGAA